MPEQYRKMSVNQRHRLNTNGDGSGSMDSGILNERILVLVFKSINWDIRVLCQAASVSRKLRALAKRLLWREVCVYRAPRMMSTLTNGGPNGRIGGGWHAVAKLLFFCCGCESTRHFPVAQPSPGHFVKASRFSKTSGRSFLTKKCRGDLLYVSDPCEHPRGRDVEDDLGIYRGIFRGFVKSRTRAFLIARRVELEERVRCPYCGARVWSMTTAKLVPKSAAKRLGSSDGGLEFFVCVNGHLHGTCWLIPLSSDEADTEKDDDDSGLSDDDDENSGPRRYDRTDGVGVDDQVSYDSNNSSVGDIIVEDGPAS
ncbi:EID1-like F-box protein 3 [Sarracenia purpurea var. burkii]